MIKDFLAVASSKTTSKLTIIFFLGLFVAVQIAFSPIIDGFIAGFFKSYIGLELPVSLQKIPFKSVLIFWLVILSIFIFTRFGRTGVTWLIDRKEKIFITSLLFSSQFIALTGGKLEISDFTALAVLFFWIFYIVMDREYKIIWSPLYIPLLLFLISVLLSVMNGGRTSFLKLPAVMKSIVVFILMVNMIRDREIALFSLKMFISITAVSAIIGILQEIIFFFTGVDLVGAIPEDLKSYMWETTPLGQLMRVPALTSWYTILANYLSIALIVGANLILYSVLTMKKERLFLYIAMPLMFIALYLTFSHSVILVLLLAVIVSIVIRWPSLSIHVSIFLVVILLAFVSGFITDFVEEPKKYIITEDLAIRVDLFRDGVAGFFNRHPFIGNGIGRGFKYTGNVDGWPVHNNFVLIADELGLFGLFTYCSLFFVFIYRQFVSILKLTNKKDKAVSLSLFIAFSAYLANLQVQAQHIDFFIFMYLGLTEAIISTLSYQAPLENSVKSETY